MRKFKPASAIGAFNLGIILKQRGIYSQPMPGVWFPVTDVELAAEIAAEVKKRNLFVEID